MVSADDVSGVCEPARTPNDLQAVIHVGLHDGKLIGVQLARFEQDVIAYADLANVVQKGTLDQRADLPWHRAWQSQRGELRRA
jgi:hypothetical protein